MAENAWLMEKGLYWLPEPIHKIRWLMAVADTFSNDFNTTPSKKPSKMAFQPWLMKPCSMDYVNLENQPRLHQSWLKCLRKLLKSR
jgi:hypothetical protein